MHPINIAYAVLCAVFYSCKTNTVCIAVLEDDGTRADAVADLVQQRGLCFLLACLVTRHAAQLSQILLQTCQLALCFQLACARLQAQS